MTSQLRPDTRAETPSSYHALPADEVARLLRVDAERGLDSPEAARRLEETGPNELPSTPPPSAAELLLHQFKSVLIYVLLAAAVLSLLLGDYLEFGAILVIAVLNACLGFAQEFRAEQALRALQALSAPSAGVLRDGNISRVPAAGIVPGDLLLLEAGDIVAADARVVQAASLALSEAPLTGESLPVAKSSAPVGPDSDLADRSSMVYQGTLVVRGRGRALAVHTGRGTEIGRIASFVVGEPRQETRLQRELSSVGRYLAVAAALICGVVFVVGIARGIETTEMLLIAASLAVAAIPEGLPAAATIVLALGVQRMAARHVIVRRLASVETLGAVTTIFTDKTGTLTQNRMSVAETWAADGEEKLLRVAALCNDAALSAEDRQDAGDPTEVALLRYAAENGFDEAAARRYRRRAEVPFDADRSRMTVVVEDTLDSATLALVKGAPEVILARTTAIGRAPPEEKAWREAQEAAAEMAGQGMRVLALAERRLAAGDGDDGEGDYIERDLTLVGLVGLADPLRPEAPDALRRAREAGIQVVMLTGDQPATARSIGRELGLEGEVVTGRELEQLGAGELEQRMQEAGIFARVTSGHKLGIIQAARKAGGVIAMTGDGVNDAPALRASDIGVAMGLGGTDIAREAADIVLTDDNFSSIVAAVEEGRSIHANMRRFIHFLLACNAAEIMVVFGVLAAAGEAVLTPLQILFVNLVTDGLPALALGVEPAAPGIMRQSPRDPSSGLLSRRSLPLVLGVGSLIALATLLAFAIGSGWDGHDLATRLAFATLVGSQLAASLGFRSDSQIAARLTRNFWLYGAIALSLAALLVVFYAGPLQDAFDTDALSPAQWATAAALSLMPLVVIEAVKVARSR